MGTEVGARVGISQGLGSPTARLVGSLRVAAEVESLFCSGPVRLQSLSGQDAGPKGSSWQAQGSASTFARRDPGEQAKRAVLAPGGWRPASAGSHRHFISSALPRGVTLESRLPAGPRPSPSLDAPARLRQARRALGHCLRTNPTDGKGWATGNRTLK